LTSGSGIVVGGRRLDRLVPTAAAAVFNEAGELLLVKRLNGQWALPGGVMELGESVEETALRETLEETGIEAVAERAVGIYSQPEYSPPERTWQVVGMVFLCRATGGRLTPSDETPDCAFFPPEALPEHVAPYHVQRIADALAAREGAPFVSR
jgi:ADP-ribose pyrophosphatase YjhB (NUDIX family)